MNKYESLIRLRMSSADAHYGGNLVDGAKIVQLFGDVATELLIRCDGDEGLFLKYNEINFKAPVYAGDYIEVKGNITKQGNTSREMEFKAYKVIQARLDVNDSAADFLPTPIEVASATGVCVVLKDNQRK
ncbi:MAG: hotdog domain-containing protein [Bacilli bacterium]